MSKKDYRVRNWRDYNHSLIERGSVTFWLDVEDWYSKSLDRKQGRPQKYSDSSIIAMLTLKQIYGLTLRSCQGFVKSIFQMMGVPHAIPHYSRVCRRQESVVLPKLPSKGKSIHIVVDSTGLKIFGEGEWKVRQHGWSKHRMWRKLHIGVDESNQLIVSAILTDNGTGDDKQLTNVLKQYQGPINQVSVDGAYDSHACYKTAADYGAKLVVPPQPNPRHKPKTLERLKSPRDLTVWEIQEKGRAVWKKESNYHRRSLAETAFYRYKQLLGDRLKARKLPNQKTEALIRCHALNRMTLLGLPRSAPI